MKKKTPFAKNIQQKKNHVLHKYGEKQDNMKKKKKCFFDII